MKTHHSFPFPPTPTCPTPVDPSHASRAVHIRVDTIAQVMLRPTHYTLSPDSTSSCSTGMDNWNFGASADGVVWDRLHEGRHTLLAFDVTETFAIQASQPCHGVDHVVSMACAVSAVWCRVKRSSALITACCGRMATINWPYSFYLTCVGIVLCLAAIVPCCHSSLLSRMN